LPPTPVFRGSSADDFSLRDGDSKSYSFFLTVLTATLSSLEPFRLSLDQDDDCDDASTIRGTTSCFNPTCDSISNDGLISSSNIIIGKKEITLVYSSKIVINEILFYKDNIMKH
jgi:hypothetical protein